jgi:site-specific recombinase XerD
VTVGGETMGFHVKMTSTSDMPELVGSRRAWLRDGNGFLGALEARGLSPRTLRAYAFDLVKLFRWLSGARKELRTLRQSDLLGFVAAQRQTGAAASSINRRLTVSRLFYRFCTGREMEVGPGVSMPGRHYRGRGRDRVLGLQPIGPSRHARLRVKTPRRVVEPLTRDQVLVFLRSLQRYRDIAIVHLMLLGGLRSCEVLSLRLSDLGIEEGRLRVRGKGDKERILPLPALVLRSLSDYLRFERPVRCSTAQLFVVLQGPRRARPMTAAGLRSLFRQRRREAFVASANPHRFRHTFGADMARAGVRLPILQRMMGHADGATTLRYIQLSMTDVADEYARAIELIRKRYAT